NYFVFHPRDESRLKVSFAGKHLVCGNRLDRLAVTPTFHAIVCKECCLRVLFPKEVETYGELRKYLAVKLGLSDSASSAEEHF
ncbi:MAG: hypothetical protein AAB682_02410, partial [Patescibacteria group bacterium]